MLQKCHLTTITDWKEAFECWRNCQHKVGQEDWRCYASHFAWGMIMSTQFHCWIYAWKILIFKNLFHTWFWFRCLNWYKMFVLFFHVMISCYWWLTRKSVLNWHGLFITPTIMVSGFHVCFWMNIPLLAFV